MFFNPLKAVLIMCFATGMIGAGVAIPVQTNSQCPTGKSAARLTGWPLNDKYPVGTAAYNEATSTLEVTVDAVALPDGKVLNVLIGEEQIGSLPPLAGGKASVTITRRVADAARVRVFDDDRPIVSANLQCVEASALPKPSPTPSVSPSPVPSPSPTSSPSPEPTQDPMPKRTPAPTPSPSE